MTQPSPDYRFILPANLPMEGEAIAAMLARAFQNDPVFGWMIPEASKRAARLPAFFGHMLRIEAKHAHVMTSPDNVAASVWLPPGHAKLPVTTVLANLPALLGVFGRHAPRALRASHAIEAHMPKGRFWYVQFVGVEPSSQGAGWGSAQMRRGLEFTRADGLPVYLETATAQNVDFYRGLGFDIVDEWSVPGGPRMWSLLQLA